MTPVAVWNAPVWRFVVAFAIPKSAILTSPCERHHDVLGLEVAVHDPLRLGAGQAGQHALQHAGALGQRHPPHPRPQRAPLDVLHRDVRRPVVLEVVVHGHDVRVAERTGHARLAHEPLRERGVGRVEGSELLQRDEPVQVALAREVDRRHAAAPELAEDLVAADRLHRFGHQPPRLPGRGVPVKAR